ncbi:GNAT family N-acetyltransferase [Haploplasma axanthum]|uniref:Ribosomal N-acetyltransferase YdaF n=1 Tax=Haploplasma axanthum TaxID=29552 RepID=A0A449BEF2_HAPAX|nr:GNAT family N-acetyltransferase [Haploplasma axanthum]VEU80802.1 Putative ribosomal N-acetyltransferase YdaF [Haploplasma axanthum]
MKKYVLNEDYYLRKVKVRDAKELYDFSKNNEVTKYLTWNSHTNVKETKMVIKKFYLAKIKQGLPASFVIVDKQNKKVIGVIDYLLDNETDPPEIGYFMNPKYWGKGIMTLALKEIVKIGFEELRFDVIGISHMVSNLGSKRVIEKNNFKYKYTIYNYFLQQKNEHVDVMYYEMDKGDYYNDKQS